MKHLKRFGIGLVLGTAIAVLAWLFLAAVEWLSLWPYTPRVFAVLCLAAAAYSIGAVVDVILNGVRRGQI